MPCCKRLSAITARNGVTLKLWDPQLEPVIPLASLGISLAVSYLNFEPL